MEHENGYIITSIVILMVAFIGCTTKSKNPAFNNDRFGRAVESLINRGDLDIAEEYFSPDLVSHSTGREDIQGLEAIQESVRTFRKAFPDMQLKVEEVLSDGDVVALRYTYSGTHRGPFNGIQATGRKATWAGMSFGHIKNGRVVELFEVSDNLGLMHQLGVIPQR